MSGLRCATCKYWAGVLSPERYEAVTGFDWEDYGAGGSGIKKQEYEVRKCLHPDIVFFERPKRNAAALVDGSAYKALLVTGPDFGCSLHDAGQPEAREV